MTDLDAIRGFNEPTLASYVFKSSLTAQQMNPGMSFLRKPSEGSAAEPTASWNNSWEKSK